MLQKFVACVVVLLSFLAAHHLPGSVVRAQGASDSFENMREQLKLDLKARRTVEFNYIDNVVNRVEAGTLPLSLVRSTHLWARKKKKYPFQYFQRGLLERARKIGLTAPALVAP